MLLFSLSNNEDYKKALLKSGYFSSANMEEMQFSDGEIMIKVLEGVKGKDVAVFSETIPPCDHFFKLCVLLNALRENGAKKIYLLLPYFAYEKQDRIVEPGEPITARLMANMLKKSGADIIISCHLHSDRVRSYIGRKALFEISGADILTHVILQIPLEMSQAVLVAPDRGAHELVSEIVRRLGNENVIFCAKKRPSKEKAMISATKSDLKKVSGKDAVIFDDMIETGETLVQTAKLLKINGARRINAVCTHGIFSNEGAYRLEKSPLEATFVTNTVAKQSRKNGRVRTVIIGSWFAERVVAIVKSNG